MDTYQILCLVGLPTLSTLIVTGTYNLVVNGSKKTRQRRKEQEIENLKDLFDFFITPVEEKLDAVSKEVKKVSSGSLASLRNDLLDCYNKCEQKGYRTMDDTKTFKEMFDAYISLGGNDIIEEDVEPSFHNLQLLSLEQDAARKHEKLSKEEKFNKTLEETIQRSKNCPYAKGE